jgi:hypothetical protein
VHYADHLVRRGDLERAEQLLLGVDASGDLVVTWPDLQPPHDLLNQYLKLYKAWGRADKVEEYQRLLDERDSVPIPVR